MTRKASFYNHSANIYLTVYQSQIGEIYYASYFPAKRSGSCSVRNSISTPESKNITYLKCVTQLKYNNFLPITTHYVDPSGALHKQRNDTPDAI